MRIYNVTVHTMEEDAVIEHGCVEVCDGKIKWVGKWDGKVSAGRDDVDGQGGHLYPGFIDAHGHFGLWQDSLGFEGDDGNEESDPCTPHLQAVDGIKVDVSFQEARQWGITTVVVTPGSSNPIGGQMCAMKTAGHRVDDMVVRSPLAMKFAMGENPKHTFHEKEQGPVTRMGIGAILRENLMKGKKYGEQMLRAGAEEDFEEPEYDMKCEALAKVIGGGMGAHFHAHLREDIFTAIRIAKEFGLEPVIVHGTGAGEIAQDLAKENVPVIVGPLFGARTKPELNKMHWSTPGRLEKAGVLTAICIDFPEQSVETFLLSAFMAVQNGMSAKGAMKAITCNPAKICGLWNRLGSISVGKDADLVLFAQEPLSCPGVLPKTVWIDGQNIL